MSFSDCTVLASLNSASLPVGLIREIKLGWWIPAELGQAILTKESHGAQIKKNGTANNVINQPKGYAMNREQANDLMRDVYLSKAQREAYEFMLSLASPKDTAERDALLGRIDEIYSAIDRKPFLRKLLTDIRAYLTGGE